MDGRWSISGLASMLAHGALVTVCLWGSARHPAAAVGGASVTELEVRSVPAKVEPGPRSPAVVAPAPSIRTRQARAAPRRPAAPVPVSREALLPQEPAPRVPDGDEDHTMEEPSPSTLAVVPAPPPAPAAPPAPPTVTALEASYLCTRQPLRSLPKALDVRGRTYRVHVQACISAEGRVERLTLQKGAVPELDWQVLADMRGWRYRPRLVQGKPSPFCYKVRVSYEVQ